MRPRTHSSVLIFGFVVVASACQAVWGFESVEPAQSGGGEAGAVGSELSCGMPKHPFPPCERCVEEQCCAERLACAQDAVCQQGSDCLFTARFDFAQLTSCVEEYTPRSEAFSSAVVCSSKCSGECTAPEPCRQLGLQCEELIPSALTACYALADSGDAGKCASLLENPPQ